MPGRRLEPNETPEDALQREMLEETGLTLACFRPIGILHFTYTDAAPEGSPYPYADFLQIVYAGTRFIPPRAGGSGLRARVADARGLPLDAGQQVFS